MTRIELINDIKTLGFVSYEHAAMLAIKGKAVKTGRESYSWTDNALNGMTIPDLEMLRKQIVQSPNRYKPN